MHLVKIALVLMLTVILTAAGFYFSVLQVHSPDRTRGIVSIVLLLPYAVVNRVFHWFTGPEPLSPPVYWAAFVLGSVAQLLYYFVIFTLLQRLAAAFRPAQRGLTKEGESQ